MSFSSLPWGFVEPAISCIRASPRRLLCVARRGANEETQHQVIDAIQSECPSYKGQVTLDTTLAELQSEADSLDALEAMMELEDRFKVELEDEWMENVKTVRDLAELIWKAPRGHKLRTVDDETYIAMIRRSHAENRWGELYDGWEKDIPDQYVHKGPSLAEEHGEEGLPRAEDVQKAKKLQEQQDSSSTSSVGDSTTSVAAKTVAAPAPTAPASHPSPTVAPAPAPVAPISTASQLRVPELRRRLRDLGMDDSGTKDALVTRLKEAEVR